MSVGGTSYKELAKMLAEVPVEADRIEPIEQALRAAKKEGFDNGREHERKVLAERLMRVGTELSLW